ncbi:HD-GYP domain-containing protein [Bosea sp. RAC05]|uniref:HD-GYP domain-containing protein n=1 Tax=Bosea sp. RAC05 TaxID=1842539 RepID=UPI00083DD824|nr:HD domain-containing phosphohydrolase [Bosea sp. RAC05]AOG03297.1 HD domain protein [Bosea sp. RAC05]
MIETEGSIMPELPSLSELVDVTQPWLATLKAFDEKVAAVSASHEDNDLDGHQRRVARSAMDLAKAYNLDEEDVRQIGAAALVHDVGKTEIDLAILNKAGDFTPAERLAMNGHAAGGASMLGQIADLPQVFVDVARYHHERYDGKGYEKLKGEDIPFAARIVQIADIHDALSRKRVYKLGAPEGRVLCEMAEREGRIGRSMFDPGLLRCFVAMRMAAPGFQATAPERAELAAFVLSDPNLDLPEGTDVRFERDGSRLVNGARFERGRFDHASDAYSAPAP